MFYGQTYNLEIDFLHSNLINYCFESDFYISTAKPVFPNPKAQVLYTKKIDPTKLNTLDYIIWYEYKLNII